ncbi:rhamnogalacturonyl hydrolase YesR [Filimonas zeae]|nr:glycoside hydrolase family 88 protein [Filimonas zeae]MDR6338092.1 rhamnogalacturonyl hydrolase YesR [Filimonas zeae]
MFKRLLVFFLFSPVCMLFAQKNSLARFPKGHTPEEVGKRLAYRFTDRKHALHMGKWISYPETFNWNGSLKFAAITHNEELLKLLKNRFEPLFSSEQQLLPIQNHVDMNMFGSLPLELYQITKEQRYLQLGLPYADTQWLLPEKSNAKEKEWADKGYSWQTRLWIDDMYMITIVQTQAYKVTGDSKYLDRAASEMVLYLNELQRPNGLFYHAPDVPFYWGRGNGWMAAGMTELLRSLPETHIHRARILEGYRTMMKSLKTYQTKAGMWNQLIDEPDCWAETSGTAMFTYALISGVKHGWLNKKEYAPVARKAWMAMVPYINDKGDVTEVCIGTNKKNDKQYYYDRKRNVGDFHGQAPYLWCVVALLEGVK